MPARRPPTPILWLCCGFLAGQLAAPAIPGWAFAAAALTAAAALLARAPRHTAARLLAVAATAAALGHRQVDLRSSPDLASPHVAALVAGGARDVELRATVSEPPVQRPAGLRLVVDVDRHRRGRDWLVTRGRLLLTVRRADRSWRRGDRLQARVRIRAPRNFGNPGEFDYEGYLARRAIYVSGYALADADWRRLPRTSPPGWADTVRAHAEAALEQVAPAHLRPLAAALLLGQGASIPDDLRERYARAGVSHILAISGLHIGLVAAAAHLACRWLLARSERALLTLNVPKLATVATLPLLLAYAAIAGTSAATLRATVMAALFLSALLLDRRRHWPTAIAVAAAAVCAVSPGAMREASFQLSFVAVIAIVLGGRVLRDAYDAWAERRLWRLTAPRLHALARGAALSQGVTTLALLATAPLTLHHFQQLSLVGLVSNVLVVPLSGMGAVSSGLAAVLLTPLLPGLGACLFAVCCAFLGAGDWLTARFAALPGADLHLPTPSVAEIATYYALLGLPLLRAPARRAVGLAVIGAAAVQIALAWVERTGDDLRVTFISVGQGDATLVEFPGGAVMLVDGGGLSPSFDVGEKVVAPLLLRRKIRRVDTVVLTHPDFDHYGGLAYVVERFAAAELWSNGSRGAGERFRALRAAVARAGTREVEVRRGFERVIGGVAVRVVAPGGGGDPANDASVVLQLSFAGRRLLLTGDVERAGEHALLRGGGELGADVLKVPHHGSRTSSGGAFVAAVRPRLAVVSCGWANRWGMPHAEVVERYDRHDARLLRTDLDGAVEIRVSPSGVMTVTSGRSGRRGAPLEPLPASRTPVFPIA